MMRALVCTMLGSLSFMVLVVLVVAWFVLVGEGGWSAEPGMQDHAPDWNSLMLVVVWFHVPGLIGVGVIELCRASHRSGRRHWGHVMLAILVGAVPVTVLALVSNARDAWWLLVPLQWNVVIGAGIEFSWLAARGRLE